MKFYSFIRKRHNVQELEKENTMLKEQCAKLEEQNKKNEEEISQLKEALNIIQKTDEEIVIILNKLQKAKVEYEEENIIKIQLETTKQEEEKSIDETIEKNGENVNNSFVSEKKNELIVIFQKNLQEAKVKFEEENIKKNQLESPQETTEQRKEESIDDKIEKHGENVNNSFVSEKINELKQYVDKTNLLLKDLIYKDTINKELHEELQIHKNGFRKEITNPILKNIIHWHDKVVDLHDFYEKEKISDKEDYKALFSKLLQEYKNLSDGLLDLLYDYDIEPFTPKKNDEHSPKTHKIVSSTSTEDQTKIKKIAECKKVGFQDVTTGRIIRPAEVIIYKNQSS